MIQFNSSKIMFIGKSILTAFFIAQLAACAPYHNLKSPCDAHASFCGSKIKINKGY